MWASAAGLISWTPQMKVADPFSSPLLSPRLGKQGWGPPCKAEQVGGGAKQTKGEQKGSGARQKAMGVGCHGSPRCVWRAGWRVEA